MLTLHQQFTVDKAALLVEDSAVARTIPKRTVRSSPLGSSSAIPRAMSRPLGKPVSIPSSPNKPYEADKPEGKSPTLLATDPIGPPDEELELKKPQDEDQKDETADREVDIYANAALSCSIENRDACEMCSG